MKPICIQHREKHYQFAYIDSEASLRNWADGHPAFSKYRFYEADADRFIVAPKRLKQNRSNNTNELIKAVKAHFRWYKREEGAP